MKQSHIAIIGAPMDLGAGRRGVDMGPSALRLAGLNETLAALGYEIEDLGNVIVDQPESLPIGKPDARYLPQIAHTCSACPSYWAAITPSPWERCRACRAIFARLN